MQFWDLHFFFSSSYTHYIWCGIGFYFARHFDNNNYSNNILRFNDDIPSSIDDAAEGRNFLLLPRQTTQFLSKTKMTDLEL